MNRKAWLWAGLALAVLIVAGLARLRFDVEVLNLLPDDLPVVQGLKLYQKNFTDSRELIVTLRSTNAAATEATARALAQTLRRETNLIASVMWQPAWLEQPAQAAELIGYLWLNQPPAEFAAMTRRLTGTNLAATLANSREQLTTSLSPMDLARLGNDPLDLLKLPETAAGGAMTSFGDGGNVFASPDGTFRLLFVKAQPDLSNYRACIAWLAQVRDLVQSARARGEIPPDTAIGFTGSPAFVAEISSGMQHDMTESVALTSVIIAVLFWFFHRRLVPMLWLLTLLAVILAATLALGGLVFGAVNVVSLGFAGILLGLAVDYGVVHYQEAVASPEATIPEIRRAIRPSIFWAAVTTISAFLVLNLGGLPGLAQLGSLVALGVTLSALVMLFAFLPPLFRDRMKKRGEIPAKDAEAQTRETEANPATDLLRSRLAAGVTALIVAGTISVLSFGIPTMDHSADALRPQHSPAYAALDEIKTNLAQNREPLWLILRGSNELEVAASLGAAQSMLERAVSNHVIREFTLPTPLWPRPDWQAANRTAAAGLVAEREQLRAAATDAGFSTNAFLLTDQILNVWQTALTQPGAFWPTNDMSRWIFEKFAARTHDGFLAVGFLFPEKSADAAHNLAGLSAESSSRGFLLSGWELLVSGILQRVRARLWVLVLPMVGLVLLSLWFAFRRPAEILLSLAVLALSGLVLLTVMRLAGWSWNLLNLMALPLMLGSGVDYSIFMQLALRRHHGNLRAAHRSVGRALLLCGGTAVAGFGSLSLSTNAGMASLGRVCAVGIAGNMLASVYLLPFWWRRIAGRKLPPADASVEPSTPHSPSLLYRAGLWRLGLRISRLLPARFCAGTARALANAYWLLAPHRRKILIQNLLRALNGDRVAAELKARELLRQFAIKIADLLRYESGGDIEQLFCGWSGWEHFEKARAQGRGILLITPHLGNWEFGGPSLTKRGVNLQVITLAEPGGGFTELRMASRARWDIDTLVIGNDPFAFVEIIRRLEARATVALLIDRPPASSQVMVELFGRPFAASLAAAELARASGCVLLPVYVPRTSRGYEAHMLPAIDYDRAALRDRGERRKLTQRIMRVFEEPIRAHLDQWYHFVPIWPSPEMSPAARGVETRKPDMTKQPGPV